MRKLLLTTAAVLTASVVSAEVQLNKEAKDLIQKQKAQRIEVIAKQAKARDEMQEKVLKSQNEARIRQNEFKAQMKAPAMSPASNNVRQGYDEEHNQWDQPYQAFGADNALIGGKLYAGSSMDNLEYMGDAECYYDTEGNMIKAVSIYKEDGYLFKEVVEYSPEESSDTYWKNNDEWILISHYSEKDQFYGIAIDGIESEIINGEQVISRQVKTEFDDQNRPVKTEIWAKEMDWSNLQEVFGVVRIYDWSYLDDMVQVLISERKESKWQYREKIEFITDDEGLLIRTSYSYDKYSNGFVGDNKEGHFTSQDGLTEISKMWYWDYSSKDWELDSKTVNVYDDNTRQSYASQTYLYDKDAQKLYLARDCYYNWSQELYEQSEIVYDNEGYVKRGNKDKEVRDQYGRGISNESYRYSMAKDSTYRWIGSSKAEYKYAFDPTDDSDDKGHGYYSEILNYKWDDSSNAWVFKSREKYEYDQWLNTSFYCRERWNQDTAEWEETDKRIEEYKMFGSTYPDLVKVESYRLNWDEQYVGYDKSEYDYDQNGHVISEINYDWDIFNDCWYGSNKESYKFDGDNMTYWATWSGTNDENGNTIWIPSSLRETEYAADGEVIRESYLSEWGEEINGWFWGNMSAATYDAAGNLTEMAQYSFVPATQDWMVQEKEVYSYQGGILLLSEKYSTISDYEDGEEVFKLVLSNKTEYLYNDLGFCTGNVTYTLNYVWNDSIANYTRQLVPYKKSDITYSGYDISEIVNSEYSAYDNVWYPTDKYVYQTDSIYNVRTLYTYSSYDDPQWTPSAKYITGSDENGKVIYEESLKWNSYYDSWRGDYKYEYAYSATGEQIMHAYYYWNGDEWVGSSKSVNEHDKFGNDILSESYYWDYSEKKWICSYHNEWKYDENQNCLLNVYLSANSLGNWISGNKNEWQYDAFGNQTSSAYYYWSSQKNDWQGNSKDERFYDEEGNSIGYAYYRWNSSTDSWTGENKSIYKLEELAWGTRDYSESYYWEDSTWVVSRIRTIEQHFREDGNFDYELNIEETFNYDGTSSTNIEKVVYIYASVTGVESPATTTAQISVVDGAIVVKASDDAQIRVNTMAGTQVATATGSATIAVPAGIYLVTVDGVTTKLMVR